MNNNNNDHAITRMEAHGVEPIPGAFRPVLRGGLPGALAGLCFVNLPGQFVGPLGELAGGIDISLPVTLGTAALLYLVLLAIFPEPAAVYGPKGPRWVPSGKTSQTSLQGAPEAA